jgi:redox-sensing transcriptional repressor
MSVKKSIKRLLQYRLYLLKLEQMNVNRFFSHNIADELGISSEQVRKDFSLYGIKGYKKAGYKVDENLKILNDLFNRFDIRNVVVIGLGNMGKAMIHNNKNFNSNHFSIVAGFDINPDKIKKMNDIPVYPLNKLKSIVIEFDVKTAIITVPFNSAQNVCDLLVNAGITGILNFAPSVLKVPKNVIVNYVNLCNELEATYYTAKTKTINRILLT